MRIYLLSFAALLAASSAMAQSQPQAPLDAFVFKKPDGFVLFN